MIVNTKAGNKLTGFYRGQVKKHLLWGKCKIWIPGVYSEEFKDKPDNLPDAEQASPFFCGANYGNGAFSYPDIDAIVWCFFENGDQNLPVYFASTLGTVPALDEFINCAPELDEQTGKEEPYISILQYGATKITMNKAGQLFIDTFGNGGKNQISINHDGTMEIMNEGQLQVTSNSMKIMCSDQIEFLAKNIMMNATKSIGVQGENIQMSSSGATQIKSKNSPTGKMI